MLTTADDKSLLTAKAEQTAFRILYNRYWEQLYRKALSRLGNSTDAEDVVQEVFISLWRNRHSIEIKDTLSPYLFTALRYCIIKTIYRKGKKGQYVPLSPDELQCDENFSEELLEYKDLQQAVNREINDLPERMREIYRLSRYENLSAGEIAERLHISEQTVKNTISATLRKLRVKLSHLSSWLIFIL